MSEDMDEESGSNELEKAKLTKKVTENPNSQELLLRCEEGQAPSLAQTAKVITDDVIRASLLSMKPRSNEQSTTHATVDHCKSNGTGHSMTSRRVSAVSVSGSEAVKVTEENELKPCKKPSVASNIKVVSVCVNSRS